MEGSLIKVDNFKDKIAGNLIKIEGTSKVKVLQTIKGSQIVDQDFRITEVLITVEDKTALTIELNLKVGDTLMKIKCKIKA